MSICLNCNSEFLPRKEKQKFCCLTCYRKWRSGKSFMTQEGIETVKQKLKGRLITWGDKISKAKKGIVFSVEHIKNLSISHIGKNTGEENNKWKGGISKINKPEREQAMQTPEYKRWRNEVFGKYNKCQRCGAWHKKDKLNAHHIKQWSFYPESRYDPDNGIVFCKKCHKLYHKIFGINEVEKQDEHIRDFVLCLI